MGRLGLAESGNVVVLAFHRHQCDARDPGGIDRPAAMGHLALRQRMLDEHQIDGLQVIFRGQVHHGEILVVEVAVLVDQVPVALHEVHEQVLVRVHVAIEVHADEAVELQEARIDVAHHAGMRKRHLGDDVAAEPVDALLGREVIDRRRIFARVDGPAHQRHRQRNVRIALGFHHRHRGQHRHGRLTDRDHVDVAAEHVEHLDQIIDIVLEIEAAFRHRHHPRVGPVGDVDLMGRQKGFHRPAQQGRIVTGHRRH